MIAPVAVESNEHLRNSTICPFVSAVVVNLDCKPPKSSLQPMHAPRPEVKAYSTVSKVLPPTVEIIQVPPLGPVYVNWSRTQNCTLVVQKNGEATQSDIAVASAELFTALLLLLIKVEEPVAAILPISPWDGSSSFCGTHLHCWVQS